MSGSDPGARERELMAEVELWRSRALTGWQEQVDAAPGIRELLALKQSISWRVTRPLRLVRGRLPR